MRAWRRRHRLALPGTPRPSQPPRSTWSGRLLRGLRPDHNPLRRGTDRAETAMLAGLLAAFLAGAPLAANAAGSWAHAMSVRETQAQQAVSHQVTATLLQAAPGWDAAGIGADVQARWTSPDGQVRTGQVYSRDGAVAGSTVRIWVDRTGHSTAVPLQPSQIEGRTELAEAIAVVILVVVLVVAGLAGRWALDRRRLAGWEAEWLAAGTRWRPGGKTPASGD